jgi:hypothetical protein
MIACLANSPGSKSLTADWISRADKVCFLLYLTNLEASKAILSKTSLMKEFMMAIDFLLIPVSW